MTTAASHRYHATVVLALEPAWLALDRQQRGVWAARLGAVCEAHPSVAVEWFDADGLSGRHTDFMTCRFDDLEAYQFLWDALRDTEPFFKPYMRIVDVILGRSNGYKAYEASLG